MPILNIQRTIIPPLGFLAAAKQDSIYSATNLNIGNLSSSAQQSLPEEFEIQVIGTTGQPIKIYGWTGSAWTDYDTFEEVTTTDITGIVHFRNPANYDVEFIW